jgi:hypothetical protein
MEAKVDALSATQESALGAKKDTETAEHSSSSKLLTGGTLGLLGLKVGSLIGSKIGFGAAFSNNKWLNPENLPFIGNSFKKLGEKSGTMLSNLSGGEAIMSIERANKIMSHSTGWAAITGVALGAPLALLGYSRGDRLQKTSDLIAKPLDSLHRLTISSQQFEAEHPGRSDKKSWAEKVKPDPATEISAGNKR